MSKSQIKVPDIGADSAEVIEVLISEGDSIEAEQSVIVLESDKASMEVPAPVAGKVGKISVKVGDQLAEGDLIAEIETADEDAKEDADQPQPADSAAPEASADAPAKAEPAGNSEAQAAGSQIKAFKVPDIGSDTAEVIEVSVSVGDAIEEGDTICVAESDKASLEVPAEVSGKVVAVSVKEGDRISEGADLIEIEVAGSVAAEPASNEPAAPVEPEAASQPKPAAAADEPTNKPAAAPASQPVTATATASGDVYAGPAVRKLARELGVDLARIPATGARGRVLKDDLQNYVKQVMSAGSTQGGAGVPSAPVVDWSKFGQVRIEPMTKIHRVTAENMSRAWLNVPHVTQFDDADVTELEDYRAMLKAEGAYRGVKMTPVAFILKLVATTLLENPKFNSSLHQDGQSLVYRDYCHLGLAVDTPVGLMVPVIKDVNQKDIWQLAEEIMIAATKAKEGKLKPNEMQGACFTISSLGAIGGRGFTPIVPAPQVGILGVSKTAIAPVWDGQQFAPRKLMPLALSYDHRAVNGGDAGRFLTRLVELLGSADNLWS